MNGVSGCKVLPKIEGNIPEVRIFIQYNMPFKNMNRDIYTKANTRTHLLSSWLKTYPGAFCQADTMPKSNTNSQLIS